MAARLLKALTAAVIIVVAYGNSEEDRLYDLLFKQRNYNTITRPVQNSDDSVCVNVSFALEEIVGLSMKSQSMTAVTILTIKWDDFRLKWDRSAYNNTASLNLPSNLIWTPDVVLYNKAEEKSDEHSAASIINVQSTGECVWTQPHRYVSTCNVDVTDFPFDKQVCTLSFGSWTMGKEQMVLKHLTLLMNDGSYFAGTYTSGGDWRVDKIVERSMSRNHGYLPTIYSQMTYSLHVTHRPNYYILYMLLPCIIISILILLVFVIPPDAGERIGLGITVLLNMSVYLLVVADHLPQTSEQSPLLGVFYVTIMYEIGWAFIASIINLYLYYKKTEAPDYLRKIFRVNKQQKHAAEKEIYSSIYGNGTPLSVFRRHTTKQQQQQQQQPHANGNSVDGKEDSHEEVVTAWQVIGRTLDFVCFWFFSALFIVTTVSIIMLKPKV